jgi:hypothetical protein
MLLATHVGAYAGLALEELTLAGSALKRQLMRQLLGLLFLSVAAVLCGVAVLLWVFLPGAAAGPVWVFVMTPLVPALLAVLLLWRPRQRHPQAPLMRLRLQLLEDVALLNRHSAP